MLCNINDKTGVTGGVFMKKIKILFAIMALFMIWPITAYANSALPDPHQKYIAVEDYPEVSSITILGSIDGVHYEAIGMSDSPQETRRQNEKVLTFINEGGKYKKLKIEIKISQQWMESNTVDLEQNSSFIYHVRENRLEAGPITSWKAHPFTLIVNTFFLGAPLIVTLVTEWLISLAFKLKPGCYILINLATNPVMNILISILYNQTPFDYYVLLLILEVIMAALEFGFYLLKYKGYTKRRLLFYTVVANLTSWGIYYLISSGWY